MDNTTFNNCRVCKKTLKEGEGRYNDHMLFLSYNEKYPICVYCSKNNPDELNKKFKTEFNLQ